MRALASGLEVDTEIAVFRMEDQEGSNIVLPDGRRPAAARLQLLIGPFRDSRVGLYCAPPARLPGGPSLLRHARRLSRRHARDDASTTAPRRPLRAFRRGSVQPARSHLRAHLDPADRARPGHEPGPPHTFNCERRADDLAEADLRPRRRRCSGSGFGVLPELLAHDAADLADRGAVLQRGAHRLEQVGVAGARLTELLEAGVDGGPVALLLELLAGARPAAARTRGRPSGSRPRRPAPVTYSFTPTTMSCFCGSAPRSPRPTPRPRRG